MTGLKSLRCHCDQVVLAIAVTVCFFDEDPSNSERLPLVFFFPFRSCPVFPVKSDAASTMCNLKYIVYLHATVSLGLYKYHGFISPDPL
jgi:hypothetical protein